MKSQRVIILQYRYLYDIISIGNQKAHLSYLYIRKDLTNST